MKATAVAALLLTLLLAPAASALAAGPPAALVRLGKVAEKEVETKVTLTGTAEAHRMITVASRVEALAERGLVEEGQTVAKGQVLLELDTSRLLLQIKEAQAQVAEALTTLEQLKRDLTRSKVLQERNAVPLKNLEDAQTAVDRQNSLVEKLRAQVAQLQLDLAYAKIRAPLAGVVVRRLAWRGEWVKKGGAVITLAVLDPIKVVVQVPERYLPALAAGQAACATADALPGREFCGKIMAVIPSGNDRSRAFPVQVGMANPDGAVKPGMFMRLTLGVGHPHKALLIPKDALVMSGDSHSVFTVLGGKAAPIPVKLVAAHGDMLEVTGRLKAGMTIVTVGNERLFPGQPVKAAPPAPAPAGK